LGVGKLDRTVITRTSARNAALVDGRARHARADEERANYPKVVQLASSLRLLPLVCSVSQLVRQVIASCPVAASRIAAAIRVH